MTEPPARMAASGPYSHMCSAQKYELSSGNCNGGGGVGCRAPHLDPDASVCGGPFQVLHQNLSPFSELFAAIQCLHEFAVVVFELCHTPRLHEDAALCACIP